MKKTDLEKNKAVKLREQLKHGATPARFAGDAAGAAQDRREQRRLDQAQGLVAFPVKLQQSVIDEIRARATAANVSTNEIVGELLAAALKKSSGQ